MAEWRVACPTLGSCLEHPLYTNIIQYMRQCKPQNILKMALQHFWTWILPIGHGHFVQFSVFFARPKFPNMAIAADPGGSTPAVHQRDKKHSSIEPKHPVSIGWVVIVIVLVYQCISCFILCIFMLYLRMIPMCYVFPCHPDLTDVTLWQEVGLTFDPQTWPEVRQGPWGSLGCGDVWLIHSYFPGSQYVTVPNNCQPTIQ